VPHLYFVPPGQHARSSIFEAPFDGRIHVMGPHVHPYAASIRAFQFDARRKVWSAEARTNKQRGDRANDRGVPDANLLLGLVYKGTGDHAAAERELLEAERLNSGNAQAALELGKLLLARGDLQAALTRLKRAERQMPANAAVYYQLGIVYRRLGREQGSERHFGSVSGTSAI
jgi:tetratricopeptide (TPR) repeat protein